MVTKNTSKTKSSNSIYVNSPSYIEDRDTINSAIEELAISANSLAKTANVSPAALSQAIGGKYPSCPKTIFEAALKAIDSIRATRGYNGAMPFVKTSVVKQVQSTCDESYALRHSDAIGLITGRVGVGKTTALMRYCRDTRYAIYMRASEGMSKSELLIDLLDLISMQVSYGTIASKQGKIVKFLKNNPRLIVLDEASRCTRRVIETLRDITDTAQAGLVLAGREILYERFSSNQGDFGEIASRIHTWNPPIQALTKSDIYLIINKAVMTRDLDEETKDMLHQCSESTGRVMQKLHNWRANMQRKNESIEITPAVISQIYQRAVVPMSAAWRRGK